MFYNFKDQILEGTETRTEYRYCQYFCPKVPNIVPSVLFWKSIPTVMVGTLKVPSAPPLTLQHIMTTLFKHPYDYNFTILFLRHN